jgi:hypothetical protein
MPATFDLELVPGQHVAIDTALFSNDLDMGRLEDGTIIEGRFWGLLDIIHHDETHKMNFSGTRLTDQEYPQSLLVNSRVMAKLAVAAKPMAAKCHLSILAPRRHDCDVILSLSDSWTLGITWPPADNIAGNGVMYSLRVHPGGALQHFASKMVTTTLYYEAMCVCPFFRINAYFLSLRYFSADRTPRWGIQAITSPHVMVLPCHSARSYPIL